MQKLADAFAKNNNAQTQLKSLTQSLARANVQLTQLPAWVTTHKIQPLVDAFAKNNNAQTQLKLLTQSLAYVNAQNKNVQPHQLGANQLVSANATCLKKTAKSLVRTTTLIQQHVHAFALNNNVL